MATMGMTDAERDAIAAFEQAVITPSMTQIVILDFWAEWCGPCKQLGPILDKVAADYAGKGVRLVKIDVDKDKLIAAQFRIQSVPTVYAIYQGQPVADLTNYRSEGQLTKVLEQLLSQFKVQGPESAAIAELEPLIALGEQALTDGNSAQALTIFSQLYGLSKDNPAVLGGLARAHLLDGETETSRALLAALTPDLLAKPEIARALAALDVAEAGKTIDMSDIERRIAADPDDLDARFELAGALMSGGRRDEAADALLALISADRDWNGGAARQRFLQLLEAQGLGDPWSSGQRRRLSAVLFT